MTYLGMDVEQARQHAELIRSRGQRLEDLLEEVSSRIQASDAIWRGPDADAFRDEGQRMRSTLAEDASTRLLHAASTLEDQAEGQDQASASGGSASENSASEGSGGTSGSGSPDVAYDSGDRGTVDPEVAEAWELMSDEERRLVAQQIVNDEMERYGLDPVEITFEAMDGNGYWSEGDGVLAISTTGLSDPDILHTLAHEVRHAAQHEFVEQTDDGMFDGWFWAESNEDAFDRIEQDHGVTQEEIESWGENFEDGNYVSPPEEPGEDATDEQWQEYREDFDEYLDQPVEADARGGGREFVESLTLEDLQELQSEAGVPESEDPE